MGIQIRPVGGFMEIGRNMTAVNVDGETVIFDAGFHMPNYISCTEDEDVIKVSREYLLKNEAIPDDRTIEEWRKSVKAIIPSHAHLDHIGAIPYLASRYKCPIIATPFTIALIQRILRDEKIDIPNKLIPLNSNQSYKLSEKLTVHLIHVTHSTPQSTAIALETPYGFFLYANDFKMDNDPVLGAKPNIELMKKIGKAGVLCAIVECLNAEIPGRTPTEAQARARLQEALLGQDYSGRGIIVTTFSSHIARLKSIVECGKKLNRKVVFLGRSLSKYVMAAQDTDICHFPDAQVVGRVKKNGGILKEINANFDKYLVVMTGHQGEPKSVLARVVRRELPLNLSSGDVVVFSCKIIPALINKQNRAVLEKNLEKIGTIVFKDLHCSGHADVEDLREFLGYLQPKHIIPSHGGRKMVTGFYKICEEMGYIKEKTFHELQNGDTLEFR